MLDPPPLPHHFSTEHAQFRAGLREFVARAVTSHVADWDEAGSSWSRADRAVQTLGGMGFMRGTKIERLYREVR